MSSTKLSVKIYFKRELRFGMSNSAKKEYQCSRILTYWNSPVFSKYVQQTYFETYTQIFPDGKRHNAMEIQIVDELYCSSNCNNYDMIWSHWHMRDFFSIEKSLERTFSWRTGQNGNFSLKVLDEITYEENVKIHLPMFQYI